MKNKGIPEKKYNYSLPSGISSGIGKDKKAAALLVVKSAAEKADYDVSC